MTGAKGLIIGICGGSASGKSMLAQALLQRFSRNAIVLSQDAYYRDSSHLNAAEREQKNYDHPDAIDLQLFAEDLQRLARGNSIQSREYCFASHRSQPGDRVINPAAVTIVEGLFMFEDERLRHVYDLKVFMHASAELRLKRRLLRDSRERGRSREHITRQYYATVKPMHELYVEPNRQHAQIILSPCDHQQLEVCAEKLVRHIKMLQQQKWPG